MDQDQIQHIFVLMLENRAFDHMLGFSGITGTDAATNLPTSLRGLTGTETNTYNGTRKAVSKPALFSMCVDPAHEFTDVLGQLCGSGTTYPRGGPYPPITTLGSQLVTPRPAKERTARAIQKRSSSRDDPSQLPVLTALATEFAICDNWFCSMPGPTWPNRMFVHAASSGGLDHSPTSTEIIYWEGLAGYQFVNGSIFDRIAQNPNLKRRFYAGEDFPMVSALKGIHVSDIRRYKYFAGDLQGSYDYNYVFIEPSYCLPSYRGSTSQHPLADITLGEGPSSKPTKPFETRLSGRRASSSSPGTNTEDSSTTSLPARNSSRRHHSQRAS